MLDYYAERKTVPAAVRIGRAARLRPRQLYELFPAGAVKTVFRMAGLDRRHDLPEPASKLLLN